MMQYREQILAYAIQYKGDWYKTVSYTHLDVYKRQVWDRWQIKLMRQRQIIN